jgi:hypothetical protein
VFVEVDGMVTGRGTSVNYEIIEVSAPEAGTGDKQQRRPVGTFVTYEAACKQQYKLEQNARKLGSKCEYRVIEHLRLIPWT